MARYCCLESLTRCLYHTQVPYQENGCDGGVFVFRYAYALFVMRFTIFTWDHIESRLKKLITEGPAFRFDTDDIFRIRFEMGILIKRLEEKYCTIWLRKGRRGRKKRSRTENDVERCDHI